MLTYATFAKCIDVIDVEKRIKSGQDLNSLVFLVVGGFPAIQHLKSHPRGYH